MTDSSALSNERLVDIGKPDLGSRSLFRKLGVARSHHSGRAKCFGLSTQNTNVSVSPI
jgi:hypothetical protein